MQPTTPLKPFESRPGPPCVRPFRVYTEVPGERNPTPPVYRLRTEVGTADTLEDRRPARPHTLWEMRVRTKSSGHCKGSFPSPL